MNLGTAKEHLDKTGKSVGIAIRLDNEEFLPHKVTFLFCATPAGNFLPGISSCTEGAIEAAIDTGTQLGYNKKPVSRDAARSQRFFDFSQHTAAFPARRLLRETTFQMCSGMT